MQTRHTACERGFPDFRVRVEDLGIGLGNWVKVKVDDLGLGLRIRGLGLRLGLVL